MNSYIIENLPVIVVTLVAVIITRIIIEKKKKKKAEKENSLKQQEEREQAEILRKQQEEKQWQEDIRTGKVNLASAETYFNLGITFMAAGENDAAIAQFTKAIGCNPRHKGAYYNRGMVYSKMENFDKEITDYEQALRLDDSDLIIRYNKGMAHIQKKDFQQAYYELRKVSEEMGYSESSFDTAAKVLVFFNLGVVCYNIAVEHQASDSSWKADEVRHYLFEAKFSLEDALKLDPNNADVINLFSQLPESIRTYN